jgi:integrase
MRELVCSLKTTEYRTAAEKCGRLMVEVNKLLRLVRSNPMLTATDIRKLCRELFKSYVDSYQAALSSDKAPILQKALGAAMNAAQDGQVEGQLSPYTPLQLNPIDIDKRTHQLIDKCGLDVMAGSPSYAHLKSGVRRALDEWEYFLNESMAGNLSKKAQDNWFIDLYPDVNTDVVEVSDADKLSDVFTRYQEEKYPNEKELKRAGNAVSREKLVVGQFIKCFGDLPINKIDKRTHAAEFKGYILKLPTRATERFPDKSFKEISSMKFPDVEIISKQTMNHYILVMAQLLNWAKKHGFLNGDNPFSGMEIKIKRAEQGRRDSFTPEDLQVIFHSPQFTGCKSEGRRSKAGDLVVRDHKYWIPLIALFSGARMQEICQLYTSDFYDIQGIYCFDINTKGQDKFLKTEDSVRIVPVHSKLLELGLREFVENQQGQRLFPTLPASNLSGKYSDVFSSQFSTYLKGIGFNKAGEKNKKVFHSFRNTFVEQLNETEVSAENRSRLVGHQINAIAENYDNKPKIPILKKNLEKVQFDCIDWEKLKATNI